MAYEDDETLEQLRRIWDRHGKLALLALAFAAAGAFGGRWYQAHRAEQAQLASGLYSRILGAADYQAVAPLTAQMLAEHAGSPYAVLAQFRLAPLAVAAGSRDSAATALRWVMDHATADTDRALARLRLARLELDGGNMEAAAQLIEAKAPDAFAADHAELVGDVARARQDPVAARSAYSQALELAGADSGRRTLLQLKLDDLGS